MPRAFSRRGLALMALLAWILAAAPARAQAWVPDVGDGTVAWSTQYTRVTNHLFSMNVNGLVVPGADYLLGPGNQGYLGDIVTYTSTLTGEYVPVKNLAITGEAIHIASRYKGRLAESPFDDGRFHGDLEDMVLGARYMVRSRSCVITPSFDLRFPLTHYNRFGHVGAGSGLTSATLGLNSGISLDALLRSSYAFANYARIIVEDSDGFSLDRNQWTGGFGLFFTRALSAQAQFQYVDTVDGVDWWWADPALHSHHQNVAAKATYRRLDVSAGLSVSRRVGLALSWEGTVSGANVHAAQMLTAGLSYGFQWRRAH